MTQINFYNSDDSFYQLEQAQHSERERSKLFEKCLQVTIQTNSISREQFQLLSDSWDLPISDKSLKDKVLKIATHQQEDAIVKDIAELFFNHSFDWNKIKQLLEDGKNHVVTTLNSFPSEIIRHLDSTSKTTLVYVAERSCELAKKVVLGRTALEIHELLKTNIFEEEHYKENVTIDRSIPDIESIAYEVDFDIHIPPNLEHLSGPYRTYLFQNLHLIGILEKCCNREYFRFEDFLLFEHSEHFFQACLNLTEKKGQILYDCLLQEPQLLALGKQGLVKLAYLATSFEATFLLELANNASGLAIEVLEARTKKLLKLNEYQIKYLQVHPAQAPLLDLPHQHICKHITLSCAMGTILKKTDENRLDQFLENPKLTAFVINHLNDIPGIDALHLDQIFELIEKLQYDIPICRYVIQGQVQNSPSAIIHFLDQSKVILALIKLRKKRQVVTRAATLVRMKYLRLNTSPRMFKILRSSLLFLTTIKQPETCSKIMNSLLYCFHS